MSQPTRYTACGDEVVMADPAGPLVKWEDYQRLDALCKQLMAQHSDISCENIRLRKAGDAVCESPYLLESDPAVIAWNAAKEGKPSEQKSPSFIEDLGNGVEKHDLLFRHPAKRGKQP